LGKKKVIKNRIEGNTLPNQQSKHTEALGLAELVPVHVHGGRQPLRQLNGTLCAAAQITQSMATMPPLPRFSFHLKDKPRSDSQYQARLLFSGTSPFFKEQKIRHKILKKKSF
jgi:hypothetical protein